MRQALAFLLSILLTPVIALPQPAHEWNAVAKLALDDPVLVVLWAGEKVRGEFISASDDVLRLGAYEPHTYGAIRLREINRADIRRLELVRRDRHLPNPKKWAIGGAIVGGAAGVGLGIHRDITEPTACGHACWLVDGATGAGGGYMAGLFTSALVLIGHQFIRNKLIYEDRSARPPLPHTQE
ncbi:MAG TPA: hypothetical protein VJN21_12840 [Candidatus Acidoferrales bacterium]|nr:hypothetical protein [Candidatus Acidoferrales bacterium]